MSKSARSRLAPHVPADWTSFAVHNVRVGDAAADFRFSKTADSITLEINRTGSGDCRIAIFPRLEPANESAQCHY